LTPRAAEDPSAPGADNVRRYLDPSMAASAEPLPDWWPDVTDPLVYVTFGSVAASLGLFPDLYRGVVAALAGLPIRVLLTVGDAGDPDALVPLPSNAHVERWWPQ